MSVNLHDLRSGLQSPALCVSASQARQSEVIRGLVKEGNSLKLCKDRREEAALFQVLESKSERWLRVETRGEDFGRRLTLGVIL